MKRYFTLMDMKTQYCQDIYLSQTVIQIQYNANKNPSKLFCADQQNDSKVYMKRQKKKQNS